ncbi:hypothetical protein D7Y09_16740 [bacterium 1XD42-1]|nr:hypothetical protein D7X25_31940 [bacterium 1XD42-8]RKJ60911.1 hypothetical protein D7Y09_16740 [bacterium 1XD42-1]
MCGLFGMIDYKGVLNCWEKKRIIQTLANASEIRGKDATGIAFLLREQIQIYKRALPAHKLHISLPLDVTIVMGHTRLATQGSFLENQNNHPFYGRYSQGEFALAHNGILYNDRELRIKENLPDTDIKTDSYIAVQLLEKEGTINTDTLAHMAEKVKGSFTFTVLNRQGLFIIKGNSPFYLLHFKKGFYLYASTEEIMEYVLKKLKLKRLEREEISINSGEIIHLHRNGQVGLGKFVDSVFFDNRNPKRFSYLNYYTDLCQGENDYKITKEELEQLMFQYDLDENDIQQLFCDPKQVQEVIDELNLWR